MSLFFKRKVYRLSYIVAAITIGTSILPIPSVAQRTGPTTGIELNPTRPLYLSNYLSHYYDFAFRNVENVCGEVRGVLQNTKGTSSDYTLTISMTGKKCIKSEFVHGVLVCTAYRDWIYTQKGESGTLPPHEFKLFRMQVDEDYLGFYPDGGKLNDDASIDAGGDPYFLGILSTRAWCTH